MVCIVHLAVFLFVTDVAAKSDTRGSIQGRIYNPANGEYVRNAQVTVAGTELSTASGEGGYYLLPDVPAGPVTVEVAYTGYAHATASVTVASGATASRDLDLGAPLALGGEPIKLEAFTVTTEREGNAKAIMKQKNSMDVTDSVSSDVYGDSAVDNAGEFLKNMPGVELDLIFGEVRTVRLNGLDSEYTNVTLDGVSMASADANAGVATNARAFSFEQVSLSSMESIDVSYTVSADVDANAPAGTINFRSRHAYDRKGRRISAQVSLSALSTDMTLARTYGPDDRRSYKIRPSAWINFSNSYFNNRLGIDLNLSESDAYSAYSALTTGYNTAATPTDPRPAVVTSLNFAENPRRNRKSTVNLTTDFKATPRLSLSLGLFYNYADLLNPQRAVAFGLGPRNTILGDGMLDIRTTSPTTSLISTNSNIVKQGQTLTAIPSFEYRLGDLLVEGKFAASDSISWYDPLRHRGEILKGGSPRLNGVQLTAARTSVMTTDWNIVQTGGADIADAANFSNPEMAIDDGRFARTQVYSGELNMTFHTTRIHAITWKVGLKSREEIRDFTNDSDARIYTMNGVGATGAWSGFRSPLDFDMGGTDPRTHLLSGSGGTVFVPDNVAMGSLFLEHPERFTQALTATRYYNAYVANTRHYEEMINAGFAMATTRFGRLTARAGLRNEQTRTDSLEFDPRTPAELRTAGYAVSGGVATTIDGVKYQYFSKPKTHRKGRYDNFFPSASLKYDVTRNLIAQFGFSSTIRRPTFNQITGLWQIVDTAFPPYVIAPNPRLKPETSQNLTARLAYYFEPVGLLAVNFRQNTVDKLLISNELTPEEFGYNGPLDLTGYTFHTTTQSENTKVLRGMTVEYRQTLSFLPRPFKNLSVNASYVRSYANLPLAQVIPHSFHAGLSYSFRRLNVYGNMSWKADYPITTTPIYAVGARFYRHRTDLDVGARFRINDRYALFVSARNITDEPYIQMTRYSDAAHQTLFMQNHVNWLLGVKGEY